MIDASKIIKPKQEAWNKGLTKETDERMQKVSEAGKGHKNRWNKGLTKETS